ncbi:hypothetical protein E3N88_41089 [Mikania micrantha]|uniref:RRM domain-containing protein n=1 Tax=Mikania micrantha TaxID=192012 RepID=A0A5N6LPE7_9ASTR|nr:hypothetical protein E3N88_41089 [Mikania micrantha]
MADPYWRYSASADRGLPSYMQSSASILSSQSWKPSYPDPSSSSVLQRDIMGSRLGAGIGAHLESSSNGYPSSWEDRYLNGSRDILHGTEPGIPSILKDRPDSLRKDDDIPAGGGDSNVLFVDALPSDCSRREVSHLFRPFRGFKEIRLVHKEPRHSADKAMVLCFVEFTDSIHALTALEALQGYKFDNKKPDSPALRIQFAHFPFQLPPDDTHIPSQPSPKKAHIPSQPPLDSARFPSHPPSNSAHFSSQLLPDNAAYPSKLPHDSAHFPSQQPRDNAHFPSQQPHDGAHFPSQQPRDGAHFPSQQPRDGAHFPSQQPRDIVHYPSKLLRDSVHYSSQQPRDSAHFPSQQPRDSAHFPSQLPHDSAHFPSQLPHNSTHFPSQLSSHGEEQDLAIPREKELAVQDEEPVVVKKKLKRGSSKKKEKAEDFKNKQKKFCIKCKQNHFEDCYSSFAISSATVILMNQEDEVDEIKEAPGTKQKQQWLCGFEVSC